MITQERSCFQKCTSSKPKKVVTRLTIYTAHSRNAGRFPIAASGGQSFNFFCSKYTNLVAVVEWEPEIYVKTLFY